MPNSSADELDEEPWVPSKEFTEMFVRMTDNGEVILSGPKNQVEDAKNQILDLLSQGLATNIPRDINRIEFK